MPPAAPPPAAAAPAAPAVRVFSLDQCADQYVLALSPRSGIVGLSKRATQADSYYGALARGLPQRRATMESVLAARPQVVVRTWGGEARMTRALGARGIRVVTIADSTDFAGIAGETRKVAAALSARPAGERLIGRMRAELTASAGAWRGARALYLTGGGQTAGRGTLVDAMFAAAGLTNLAGGAGYHAVSLERLVLSPPSAIVAGFFDAAARAFQHWSLAAHPVVMRLLARRTIVAPPASVLACPAPFAADVPLLIARARR